LVMAAFVTCGCNNKLPFCVPFRALSRKSIKNPTCQSKIRASYCDNCESLTRQVCERHGAAEYPQEGQGEGEGDPRAHAVRLCVAVTCWRSVLELTSGGLGAGAWTMPARRRSSRSSWARTSRRSHPRWGSTSRRSNTRSAWTTLLASSTLRQGRLMVCCVTSRQV
jgi:hypothetical protein